MTDNEIIKALEHHINQMIDGYQTYLEYGGKTDVGMEADIEAFSGALDLINRQKAEIERLELIRAELSIEIERLQSMNQAKLDMIHDLQTDLETARAEAVEEFAERLKDRWTIASPEPYITDAAEVLDSIDNLIKETEDKK